LRRSVRCSRCGLFLSPCDVVWFSSFLISAFASSIRSCWLLTFPLKDQHVFASSDILRFCVLSRPVHTLRGLFPPFLGFSLPFLKPLVDLASLTCDVRQRTSYFSHFENTIIPFLSIFSSSPPFFLFELLCEHRGGLFLFPLSFIFRRPHFPLTPRLISPFLHTQCLCPLCFLRVAEELTNLVYTSPCFFPSFTFQRGAFLKRSVSPFLSLCQGARRSRF